jgi:hypothetical protein
VLTGVHIKLLPGMIISSTLISTSTSSSSSKRNCHLVIRPMQQSHRDGLRGMQMVRWDVSTSPQVVGLVCPSCSTLIRRLSEMETHGSSNCRCPDYHWECGTTQVSYCHGLLSLSVLTESRLLWLWLSSNVVMVFTSTSRGCSKCVQNCVAMALKHITNLAYNISVFPIMLSRLVNSEIASRIVFVVDSCFAPRHGHPGIFLAMRNYWHFSRVS